MKHAILAAVSILVLAACGSMGQRVSTEGVPFETRDTRLGFVLTDNNGMTVYTFAHDETNTSNCYGDCAETWPPVTASDDAESRGPFGIIERETGARQWTFRDQPLYFYINDSESGDVKGHNISDWSAVIINPKVGEGLTTDPDGIY